MKIVVIDDDALVAISLKTIIEADHEIEVAAVGHSGKDAKPLYEEHKPDVLLMDIRMGEISGLEAGELLLNEHPEARILYLTTFMDDEYIVKALKIGAKGYILKQEFEGIVPALKAVYLGQSVFGHEIVEKLPTLMAGSKGVSYESFNLTEKEADIVKEVAEGLSNKEIASKLFLSEGTVRNYISQILEKLSLRDRTQLAVFYYKNFNS